MSPEGAVATIVNALPYPHHISAWDFGQPGQVRFTWRSSRFRLALDSLMVEETDGVVLSGSNLAIAVEGLIKKEAAP